MFALYQDLSCPPMASDKQYVQARIDALLTAAEAGDPLDESWEPVRLIAQTLIEKAQTR
ncbi:hypothetical protein ABTY20_16210 [Streptomyces sp. NPDC126497]|nr:hypothetical protein [Streptomyces sp. RO-S4]GGW25523.1 hypothetical protein GCM10010294_70680 [Streptomyces griseoloalbus]